MSQATCAAWLGVSRWLVNRVEAGEIKSSAKLRVALMRRGEFK